MKKLIALRMDEVSIQNLRQVVAVRSLDGKRLTNVSELIRESVAEFIKKNHLVENKKDK